MDRDHQFRNRPRVNDQNAQVIPGSTQVSQTDAVADANDVMGSYPTNDASSFQLIALERMPQQTHTHDATEDWTGVSDAKSRRKLQNRLNQRARRKRTHRDKSLLAVRNAIADAFGQMRQNPVEAALHMQRIEQIVAGRYMTSPSADTLLTLVQFNVFRALVDNTNYLGVPVDWVEEDAVSSIYKGSFSSIAPPSLQPTPIQQTAEHHPWLDFFPFAIMRDNIIRLAVQSEALEDDLCADIVGWCRSPGDRTGLVVWQQPWDPFAWEATEGFLRKWGWTVAGCSELYYATNHWRSVRGEDPLDIEALVAESSSPLKTPQPQ